MEFLAILEVKEYLGHFRNFRYFGHFRYFKGDWVILEVSKGILVILVVLGVFSSF